VARRNERPALREFGIKKGGMRLKKYSRCSKSPTNLNVSPDFHEPRILQWIDKRRNEAMTRFKLVGAAAILSMMVAPPVFAQAAIRSHSTIPTRTF